MKAIIQCADTGPLESLVVMLRSVGYHCFVTGTDINRRLRAIGCDTVIDNDDLVRGMGYDRPFPIQVANLRDMDTVRGSDIYVDIKAHRAYDKITREWPNLERRVLWYRINGSKPEHVIKPDGFDCGDEVNPPCPVITPNQWYGLTSDIAPYKWEGKAYACWPKFYRFNDYNKLRSAPFNAPLCFIHRVNGWGYQELVPNVRALGVKVHGAGSPDGLIDHSMVPGALNRAIAMVHLKSNDAPGYALYEALAAGCPVVLPRRLIWRCRVEELFQEGETCLCFDRETHDPLSLGDVDICTAEIKEALTKLENPGYNSMIGLAGRDRLKELMWREDRDAPGLALWFKRNFP